MVLGAELACSDCGGMRVDISNPGHGRGEIELLEVLHCDADYSLSEVDISYTTFYCQVCDNEYHFHSDGTIHTGSVHE